MRCVESWQALQPLTGPGWREKSRLGADWYIKQRISWKHMRVFTDQSKSISASHIVYHRKRIPSILIHPFSPPTDRSSGSRLCPLGSADLAICPIKCYMQRTWIDLSKEFPRLNERLQRVYERPAFKRSLERAMGTT